MNSRRILRGFRIVELSALLVLLALVLGVYLVKAGAGRERGDITDVESQIADEQHRLRLLQAEVAHLEQPERLERLSEALGLAPTAAKHEADLNQLPDLARQAALASAAKPERAPPPAAPEALR